MTFPEAGLPGSLPSLWRRFCFLAAAGTILLGLIVAIGWHAHFDLLIRIAPGQAPMQYNTALCFVLAGATFLAWLGNRPRTGLAAPVAVITLLSVLTLAEYLSHRNFGIDELLMTGIHNEGSLHPGRMSPISALGFVALGATFAALLLKRSWSFTVAGVLLLFLVSLSFIALCGYVFGLPGTYAWGQMSRVAVHSAGGFILLGLGLLAAVWQTSVKPDESTPRWLPVSIAVGTATITVVLYAALQEKQHAEVARTVHSAAENTKNQITIRMEARIRSLERMAGRWEKMQRPTRDIWEADANNHVHDFPDMQAIEWIDPSHRLQWIAPMEGNEEKVGRDLLNELNRRDAAARAEANHQPTLTPAVTLFRGGMGFIIYIPLTVRNQPDGVLGAVLNADTLFARYLPPGTAPGQSIQVWERGHVLFERDISTRPTRSDWTAEQAVELHGTTWTLRMWPTSALLSQIDDPLPEIVLVAGLVGSFLLALVCHLIQRSTRLERITSRARDALQRALDDVKTLKGLLPICACCKRIRDDTGYWSQVDTYIHHHTDVQFSHGYCPECAARAFTEFGLEVPDRVKEELAAHRFE